MWEITLLGKPSDIVYFLELKNTTKKIFGSNALVVITFEKYEIAPGYMGIVEFEIPIPQKNE